LDGNVQERPIEPQFEFPSQRERQLLLPVHAWGVDLTRLCLLKTSNLLNVSMAP